MKLLTVVPICKEDAARAELLLDIIYQIEGRKSSGYGLLVFEPNVHAEMRDKLIIAAQLAFESVDVHQIQKLVVASPDKGAAVYAMFSETARFVSQGYRCPWLWVEPDCMPLKPGWRDALAEAYDAQPRRYLSRWLKFGEQTGIGRVGVYPVNINVDLEIANVAQVPFAYSVVNKSTKSELFQEAVITSIEQAGKIRPDAVLLHSDKQGLLADWVRQSIAQPVLPEHIQAIVETTAKNHDALVLELEANGDEFGAAYVASKPKRGRPAKIKSEEPVAV